MLFYTELLTSFNIRYSKKEEKPTSRSLITLDEESSNQTFVFKKQQWTTSTTLKTIEIARLWSLGNRLRDLGMWNIVEVFQQSFIEFFILWGYPNDALFALRF